MDNNYVNEFFQKFGKGVSCRRIAMECKNLYEKYSDFVLSNNSGNVELTVIENEEKYGFIFKNTYPFQPPKIYYNGEPYLDLLRITNNDERKIRNKEEIW